MAEDDTFIKSAVILNQHTWQNNPDTGRPAWSVFFPPGKEKKKHKIRRETIGEEEGVGGKRRAVALNLWVTASLGLE